MVRYKYVDCPLTRASALGVIYRWHPPRR